jgi:hypothetical protein
MHLGATMASAGLAEMGTDLSRPQDAPIIEHPLVGSDEDVRTLIAGARVMRGIFNSPPLRDQVRKEYLPGEAIEECTQASHHRRFDHAEPALVQHQRTDDHDC